MRVAIIQAGQVINIVEARDFADALEAYPNCTARAAIAGDVPMPSKSVRILSVQDFRGRFSDAELTAIAIASRTDSALALLLLKLQTRNDVDLDDPQIVGGLSYLVSLGLMTAASKTAKLA